LREEAQFLRDYLEIERVRFQDRLTIKFDLPEDTLELPVPFLILQPLVENAIRHGFASSVSHGCIEVIACRENDSLKLIVRDNGAGISPQSANAVHSGVGIANTRARLRQLSASAELHLENGNQRGAQATIVFPISATTE
jgi:sensor histidine kinase YesM